jgi:AcrR family transcriptional regulator
MPPKVRFTREQITAVALDIVRKGGIANLTARALGKALGASSCPIFTAFENMDEVRAEVIKASKAVYARYVQRGLQEPLAFKGVGMQYIQFAKEEPQLFKLLFMSEHKIVEPNQYLPTVDDNYEDILSSVVDGYDLPRDKANRLYLHLSVYVHGIATLYADHVCTFSTEEVSQMLTEVFVSLLKNIKGERRDD